MPSRSPRPLRPTAGETQSEGGFAANRVSAASLLEVGTATDKKGHKLYTYGLLVRTGELKSGGLCNVAAGGWTAWEGDLSPVGAWWQHGASNITGGGGA